MFITFQYRLLPTRRQHRALEALLESQRQLYNAALEERIGAHRKAGRTVTYFDQTKSLTGWRNDDQDARACPVQIQRATLKRLDEAYKGFFRRLDRGMRPGFPRFQGKERFRGFAFRTFSGIRWENGKLCFESMPGALRVHLHRAMPAGAAIKSCGFHRRAKGWSVSFVVDVRMGAMKPAIRCVGVDLGLSSYVATSDGQVIPGIRAARKGERRLRVAQRLLSRKQPGSRSRVKAKRDLARVASSIVQARTTFLHQLSARLIREFDVIAIEALSITPMHRGPRAAGVQDAAWGRFISMLRYKAEWAGTRLIEVPPFYSTQGCSGCGCSVPKDLSVRWHKCPHCGLVLNRDINAARNILDRAGAGPSSHNAEVSGRRADGSLRGLSYLRDAPKAVYVGV